jgi:hypothetical protein
LNAVDEPLGWLRDLVTGALKFCRGYCSEWSFRGYSTVTVNEAVTVDIFGLRNHPPVAPSLCVVRSVSGEG